MKRHVFESICNEALSKLTCPVHTTPPARSVRPSDVSWHWIDMPGKPYMFIPKGHLCGQATVFGACDALIGLMEKTVFDMYKAHSPIEKPS